MKGTTYRDIGLYITPHRLKQVLAAMAVNLRVDGHLDGCLRKGSNIHEECSPSHPALQTIYTRLPQTRMIKNVHISALYVGVVLCPYQEIIMAEQAKETKLYCAECDTIVEDSEPGYECGSCGEVFSRSNSYDGDSHQCPSCLKFASKVADECCSSCGSELEEREVVQDETGEWVLVENVSETPPEQGM